MDTLCADISEHQTGLDVAAYAGWSQAIIIRALYGTRTDNAWDGGQRRDDLHKAGIRFLGIYCYIRQDQNVIKQARTLLGLLGPLRPGEKIIADWEEGDGPQTALWQGWAEAIRAATGEQPWCYSDLDYAVAHGLTPEWVAAYPTMDALSPPVVPDGEPDTAHVLWQFSPNYQVPGVGACDCSVFRGTIGELAALAYQPGRAPVTVAPAPPPRPAPAPAETVPADWQEQIMAALPVLQVGARDDREPWMVRRVQGLVFALGTPCPVTGEFDAATETAVKAFQKNHGITSDAVVGPVTWSMLITGRAP